MADIIRLIDEVSQISGNISFPELVKATTDHEVYKLQVEDREDDKVLYSEILKAANNFIGYVNRTRQRFQGDRINDVGKRIEEVFVEELKKSELRPLLLSSSGYPDMKIIDQYDRVTYLESKAVSKNWDSTFRSFYYTDGKKIDADARHLLIAWDIVEESPKYWLVRGFKLCDLYNLRMNLKLEFNSSNRALYSPDLLLKS